MNSRHGGYRRSPTGGSESLCAGLSRMEDVFFLTAVAVNPMNLKPRKPREAK